MQTFEAIDHVQLAIPPGGEDEARRFYGDLLGMREERKPERLRARGGAWFCSGSVRLHLGVETDFVPARKAHPALRCASLSSLCAALECAGKAVIDGGAFEDGLEHVYVDDPFGNRIELIGESSAIVTR